MIKTQVILARQRLRANQLVLCAGEQGFGLVARSTPIALSRLHDWQASSGSTLPVVAMITRVEHLYRLLARPPSPLAGRLMERCWPAGLLLRLPARRHLSPVVAPSGTVLVQMSAAPPLQELPSAMGEPVLFQPLAPGAGIRSLGEAVDHVARGVHAALIAWDPPGAGHPPAIVDLCGPAPLVEAPAPQGSPLEASLRATLPERGE